MGVLRPARSFWNLDQIQMLSVLVKGLTNTFLRSSSQVLLFRHFLHIFWRIGNLRRISCAELPYITACPGFRGVFAIKDADWLGGIGGLATA